MILEDFVKIYGEDRIIELVKQGNSNRQRLLRTLRKINNKEQNCDFLIRNGQRVMRRTIGRYSVHNKTAVEKGLVYLLKRNIFG